MNQPSAFQMQYPLSPRKFWKKTLAKLIFWGIILILSLIIQFLLPNLFEPGNAFSLPNTVNIFFGVFYATIFFCICLYCFYVRAYIKRYYYDCGEQFITIKKGVFAPTEIHVQYQKIQDVYVDQDIVDRIMGLYDVHIASATVTSGIEAHIDGVNADVAESLKNIILGKIHNASNPSGGVQTVQLQPQQQQINPVQFSQKISSDTYPISGRWIWSVLFSAIFVSLFYAIFFFAIFAKTLIDISTSNNTIFYWLLLLIPIIFLCQIITKSIWKSNYYFEFLPDYILLRTGIFSRQENHLPYKSIQNITNNQTLFNRILGLSTVTIQNAAQQMMPSGRGQSTLVGSGIALVWQPKEKAEELNNLLNDIVSKISPQNSSVAMGV